MNLNMNLADFKLVFVTAYANVKRMPFFNVAFLMFLFTPLTVLFCIENVGLVLQAAAHVEPDISIIGVWTRGQIDVKSGMVPSTVIHLITIFIKIICTYLHSTVREQSRIGLG